MTSAVRIHIPPTLRRFCGGEEEVGVEPGTVSEAIDQLEARFNGVRSRLLDAEGRVRGSVLVFVNQEDIRFLQGGGTRLERGDEMSIIPAFAGG
jgi:sulfur-carrier protein